jgi:8-oxo-dGTP diphosphatase
MSFNFGQPINYCPYCATEVGYRQIAARERPFCTSCETAFFEDPKLAVAVVIEQEGKVALQRRTIDPGSGLWTFPSGFVDRGEPVEEAAVREAWEEVGLQVRLDRFLGLYSGPGETVVLAVYVATPENGHLRSLDENDAVGFFAPNELPELAFPNDNAIIETWRAGSIRPVHTPAIDLS